jgi:phosphotransferase system HPr (HPr) family protein
MLEKAITIENSDGIHCRPSSEILNAANDYPDCEFFVITDDGEETELNSILALISLGLHRGDQATVRVEGDDDNEEGEALEIIADLFEKHFDFPQK